MSVETKNAIIKSVMSDALTLRGSATGAVDDLEKASAFYAALPYSLEKRAPEGAGRP